MLWSLLLSWDQLLDGMACCVWVQVLPPPQYIVLLARKTMPPFCWVW